MAVKETENPVEMQGMDNQHHEEEGQHKSNQHSTGKHQIGNKNEIHFTSQ